MYYHAHLMVIFQSLYALLTTILTQNHTSSSHTLNDWNVDVVPLARCIVNYTPDYEQSKII